VSTAPATLTWFARHELILAWRDFMAMMTGGRSTRRVVLIGILLVAVLILHLMAYGLVGPWVASGIGPDKETLVLLTGGGFLFWTVMLSQAMESVTRAYYARADLDLILSSPASSRRVFAVRTGATALTTVVLACLLASPIVNMLILADGAHWLAAYGVLASLGALSAAIAVVMTILLFRVFGARRTRLIAQIVAGIVGAGFVIGIQAVAILSYGSMSRFSILMSPELEALAPGLDSALWLPARGAIGDLAALAIVAIVGFGALFVVVQLSSKTFARMAIATAGVSTARVVRDATTRFIPATQKQALRRKEWKLLARDPWLLSQTLMQILYLVPPALFLWISYGQTAGTYVVVIPVLVMAAGQLAGGLAWLAISGEDAHDLVTTAPLHPDTVLIAKVEAVIAVIACIFSPVMFLIALTSLELAATTGIFIAVSAGSAVAIQLWFRTPQRRAMFRRRQIASRAATISEALSSIMWAGAAVLVAGDQWLAVLPSTLAIIVMVVAWTVSPKGKRV
jgi:ABC-2 type transport system permease protein